MYAAAALKLRDAETSTSQMLIGVENTVSLRSELQSDAHMR